MRAFLAFLALILLTLAAAATLAWPAYDLLVPQFDVRFHRVASRVWMLLMAIGIALLARRLGVADRASLGYGLRRPAFLREAGLGLALGVATMLPIVLAMFALGLRALRPDVALSASLFLKLAGAGLGTGLTVALIAETFLRGAMHSAVQRESGPAVAIALIAPLYAATHFLASYRIPPEQLGPGSGFDLLAEVMTSILERNVEVVLMGSGKHEILERVRTMETTFAGRCRLIEGYNASAAHTLLGGADLLIQPSHFHSSNSLVAIGMRYGVVPLIYGQSGLDDTVFDYEKDKRKGTGFTFSRYTGDGLLEGVDLARKAYKEAAEWRGIVHHCLKQDFSWQATAREYLKAYRRVTRRTKSQVLDE